MLKKIFFLPPLPTVCVALFGYGFVIAVAAFKVQNPVLQYASYLASAYALCVTITGLRFVKPAKERLKNALDGHPLMKKLHSTATGERLLTDVRFRTRLMLLEGFLVNLLYIALKLASGIVYHSAWFLSLAAYYALLALMRLLLMRRTGARDAALEWRRYRLCGVALLLMNQALAAMVAFMVHQNKGFDYPGLLIYGMALYAFYAVIFAAVSIVRVRRHNSPILSAAKAINLVAAMVSILSLETAMLARFGAEDDPMFRPIMTGATGGGVCIIVIGMAVYMIWRANKNLALL